MKTLKELANIKPNNEKCVYVDYVVVIGGWKKLNPAVNAAELSCPVCGGDQFIAPRVAPEDERRVRICNGFCPSNKKENLPIGHRQLVEAPKRVIEWQSFCKSNQLGDVYYDVKFESIYQSQQKIDFMRNFCSSPNGIIRMQGPPGQGKTYACLGMCELYTRTESSIKFYTSKQLLREWSETFTNGRNSEFVEKLVEYNILLVDDLGTGDISSPFISFFLDLINSRMQWKSKGTVITMNLTDEQFIEKCKNLGCIEALMDRLATGVIMEFKENNSRRHRKII